MRRITYIFVIFVTILNLFGCKKSDTGYTEIAIYYKCKNMTILDDAKETTAIFTAQSSWTISIDEEYQSWLSTSVSSGVAGHYEITVYTTNNESFESRKGYVTIVGETQQNTLTITQKGMQVVEFNDPVFETFCLENYDKDSSGYLTTAEAHLATSMDCSSKHIVDFTGFEFFTNLENANLSDNDEAVLSIENCTELENINLSNSVNLGGLEIGNNLKKLNTLNCSNCNLTNIVVDSCSVLQNLDCSNNDLSSLNFTCNSALNTLDCRGNSQLSTIFILSGQTISNIQKEEYTKLVYPSEIVNIPDVTFKQYLIEQFDANRDKEISVEEALDARYVRCYGRAGSPTNIKSLKGIEYFPNIEYFDCSFSLVDTIDLISNSKLQNIYCYSTPVESIRISAFSPLLQFDCSDSPNLKFLSLNKNTHLQNLAATNCGLEDVDFDFCTGLITLDISNNKIKDIEFTSNVGLVYLNCSNNEISSMRVRNCDSLAFVFCQNNQLNAIDIDEDLIYDIDVSNNKLSGALDLTYFTSLHSIVCDSNEITSLLLPDSSSVYSISADNNKISELQLANYTELKYVSAANNLLTDIETIGSDKLSKLYLNKNAFADTVDFSKNRNLVHLWLQDNPSLTTIWGPKGVEPLDIRHDSTATVLYK